MFQKIDVKTLTENPFELIDDRWALITAGDENRYNGMTASWVQLGILWNKPVVSIYVRPQRYTKEFMDTEEYFTLTFFGEEYRKALTVCGTKSGRDMDKVKECGFTVKTARCGAPYFEQAELVIVCRKRFVQDFDPANIPGDVKEKQYPNADYHTMYIGEIVEVLSK